MRSSFQLAVVVTCITLIAMGCVPVVAWGPMGHYITAEIAQRYLSTEAQNAVVNLLPEVDGDMGLVASWADTYARSAFPWSPPLHFIDTPDWACDYSETRDCKYQNVQGVCVDNAIKNFTTQLAKNDAGISMNVALKFAIHFVGDIHQPLHVGFTTDAGGNTEVGTFEHVSNRKLHQIWDTDIIMKRLQDDYQNDNRTYLKYFYDRLENGNWHGDLEEWRACPTSDPSPIDACSSHWASQSVVLACDKAYVTQDGERIKTGFNLEDPYYEFALPTVEEQLARGGIRLAHVLDAIFKHESLKEYTMEPKLFKELQEKKERSGVRGRLQKIRKNPNAVELA